MIAILVLSACKRDELPDSWTLTADGIEVDITRAPYGVAVSDASGNPLLSSRSATDGDGWGATGWTVGSVYWGHGPTPGYFTFDTQLDTWRDDWVVVDAASGDGSLDLTLAPGSSVDDHGEVVDGAPSLTIHHAVRPNALRVEASVSGTQTPRAWEVGFDSPADEHFLGFGERFNATDQRGKEVFDWSEEGGIGTGEGDVAGPDNPFPNGEEMSYYPVPFFISTKGYGFWLDTDARSEFDLDPADHDDAWRAWHIGTDLAYEVYTPIADDPRPWPYTLVDTFTATVGRAMVPPAWSFGPRRRIDPNSMVGDVREINEMRDEHLAITMADDSTHFLPAGHGDGQEQTLSAWTADCRALGYRAIAYYNAMFSTATDSPIASTVQEGVDNHYFLEDPNGDPSVVWLISGGAMSVVTTDYTNPAARDWYGQILQWAVNVGYSGWMYDFGEYVQVTDHTSDGRTGEEYHNRFPVDYDHAGYDAMEASPVAGNWMFFARSGYTGAWQYTPFVWSGDPAASFEDSDGLPSMLRAAIDIGISGVPNWGGDIGGFHCIADGHAAADGELLARWIEFGSTTPDMHDENACSGAQDGGAKATIWTSDDAKEAWRTYALLHTRLNPYYVSLANAAHEHGDPVVRSLFFEHPDHPEYAAIDDEYYVGPALLSAPVITRDARTRTLTLPPGEFLDWRNGTLYQGDQDVTVDAPLRELPLFLVDGQLVPLLDPTIDTLAEETDPNIVSAADVSDVYDAVGLVSVAAGSAATSVYDGTTLNAGWTGGFAPPQGYTEVDEASLSACDRCYRVDHLESVDRVRISTTEADTLAGGLHLQQVGSRRIRWDLYLAP